MAIFHLTAKFVKRSSGQSAVAKAAYNAHDRIKNDNTGVWHDYRHKGEVLFSGIFAPKDAPPWAQELAQDRQALWSAVEQRETRKNSQLAKEIEIALPHELTEKQNEYLVKDFVRENFTRKGVIADVAIHAPSKEGDGRNFHAHILMTTREINQEGFGKKLRELNTKAQLMEWREKWEHLANRHLERHGHAARVDHRSLEAQGIDREPTIHVGPTATDFERGGVKTERGNLNREIKARNRKREQPREEEKAAGHEMTSVRNPAKPVLEKEATKPRKEEKTAGHGMAAPPLAAGAAMEKGAIKAGKLSGRLTSAFLSKVGDCLEFFAASPEPRKYTPAELARDAAARREVQQRKSAMRTRDETVDRWAEMMKQNGYEYAALPPSDVRHLNKADLENIKAHGDDAIKALIEEREREKERERPGGRTRER